MKDDARARLFRAGDWNGFWALFADNLANLVILSGVCLGVFGMPAEVVYGRILPGAGVSLLFGLAFYAWLAVRLSRTESRDDVTALPYGISTPVLFVYLFGVIGPVYWQTRDGVLAWRVGLAAAAVGGAIEAAGAFLGPVLKRLTPRAGMLGTLAGIALAWIAAVPLAIVFEDPLVGFPALAIVLAGLVARARLPVPAGLLAILAGTAVAFAAGRVHVEAAAALHLPVPVLGDLAAGLRALAAHPEVLAVVLPIEIYNFIETMNNVESAEAAGDRYPVAACQAADGAGTLLGALFGCPFPTTVYIGHPAYKRLGAGAGYALGVGVVFFLGGCLGLVAFLHGIIPHAAVAPLLVFVGVVITAQAFEATPRAHGIAVAAAMIPHLSNLVWTKMNAVLRASGVEAGASAIAAFAKEGVHWEGQAALAGGAIVTGLLWGGMLAEMIDKRFGRAAAFALAGAVLSAFGIVHGDAVRFAVTPHVLGYGVVAAVFGAILLASARRPA